MDDKVSCWRHGLGQFDDLRTTDGIKDAVQLTVGVFLQALPQGFLLGGDDGIGACLHQGIALGAGQRGGDRAGASLLGNLDSRQAYATGRGRNGDPATGRYTTSFAKAARSAARRVGTEVVSTSRSRGAP